MLKGFRQDLKFAVRLWIRNPLITLISILILAIGVGASTAVFSIVHALLIKSLPYPDPEKLVVFERITPHGPSLAMSPLTFQDLTNQSGVFQNAAAYTGEVMTLTGAGEPQKLNSLAASWNFFAVMQVQPAAGRFFVSSEGVLGRHRSVVLGYSLWERSFNSDRRVIGKTVQLEGRPYVVVGVAPKGFHFPGKTDIWRPLVFRPEELLPTQRGASWVQVVGRLKGSVDLQMAQSHINVVANRLAHDYPRTNENVSFRLHRLQELLVSDLRKPLLILLAAVLLVVVMACANVTNLLLAQIQKRSDEITIRTALGAQTERLFQQFLLESFLLCVSAGILGFGIAVFLIGALPLLPAAEIPSFASIQISFPVFFYLLSLIVLTTILTGIFPAAQARNMVLSSGRVISGGSQRLRNSLVIGQIAIALILLTSAGLLMKSVRQLMTVDSGFRPENVYTFDLSLPELKYSDASKILYFYTQLLDTWKQQPGTEEAAAIFGLPMLDGPGALTSFERTGRPEIPDAVAGLRVVTPDFFRTLKIPLNKGRYFKHFDNASAPGVMIISESFARKYFPNENPLGQMVRSHVTLTDEESKPREVIGIVGDVHYTSLDTQAAPEIYLPLAQQTVSWLEIVIRSRATLPQMNASLKQVLHTLDPALATPPIQTMEDVIIETLARRKFVMTLLSGFSIVALTLAAFGIYGVLSYSVAQRTREIGVRMALGAQRSSIFALVMKKGMTLVLIGLAIGIVGTLAGTTILKALLFEVSTADPATYLLGLAILCAGGIMAIYLPARRAVSIEPLEALRYE